MWSKIVDLVLDLENAETPQRRKKIIDEIIDELEKEEREYGVIQ